MNPLNPFSRRDDLPLDDGGVESLPGGLPPTAPDAEAAAARALATARYDALAAGEGIEHYDSDKLLEKKREDLEQRPQAPAPQAVLFLKEEGDVDAIDAKDVQQGHVKDCFLLAPVAALASTPEGRTLIEKAIVPNKNERGEVISYTVTLHLPKTHLFGATTFSEKKVIVDASFTGEHAVARSSELGNEIWPLVLEKAVVECLVRHDHVLQEHCPILAMELLTGKRAEDIRLNWFRSYGPDELAKDVSAGKIVVFSTKDDLDMTNRYDLVRNHSYEVTGTKTVDGKLCVTLHNPWNHDEPQPVPFDELNTWFDNVDLGSIH
jgi:hypothetical protein